VLCPEVEGVDGTTAGCVVVRLGVKVLLLVDELSLMAGVVMPVELLPLALLVLFVRLAVMEGTLVRVGGETLRVGVLVRVVVVEAFMFRGVVLSATAGTDGFVTGCDWLVLAAVLAAVFVGVCGGTFLRLPRRPPTKRPRLTLLLFDVGGAISVGAGVDVIKRGLGSFLAIAVEVLAAGVGVGLGRAASPVF
jgi:hypothetical protein